MILLYLVWGFLRDSNFGSVSLGTKLTAIYCNDPDEHNLEFIGILSYDK